MSGDDLIRARRVLELSRAELAAVLGLGKNGHGTVLRWENEQNRRGVPGPASVAVRALLAGYRPANWPTE